MLRPHPGPEGELPVLSTETVLPGPPWAEEQSLAGAGRSGPAPSSAFEDVHADLTAGLSGGPRRSAGGVPEQTGPPRARPPGCPGC